MVDIGAASTALLAGRRAGGRACAESGVDVEVQDAADAAALADYEAFCRDGVCGLAQHPVWVRSWIAATGADAVIVTVSRDGRPAFKLALEVVKKGPFRIARFLGGSHANANFVATAHGAATFGAADRQALVAALRAARPDIDLVVLARQSRDHDGAPNPLCGFATMRSPNVSLALDLSGGFEETLARHGAARKRKKYKYQLSKFAQAGGHRTIEAKTPGEVDLLIGEFLAMVEKRFREKGIANVFGAAEVQRFLRLLFRDALDEKEPPFVLHAVEVGGRIRAVNGYGVMKAGLVGQFRGMCNDEIANTTPGYYLDYVNIERSCAEGKAVYDFGVGDEDYKRSWCDLETWQFDTLLPLTAKGRAMLFYETARAQAVRLVKSNRTAWSLVKRLRAAVAGGS